MVKSPNKVITSGTAPTTTNTTKGDLAFGTVDGETKLYGNTGSEVVELGGGGGSEVNVITPLTVTTAPSSSSPNAVAIGLNARATASSSVAIGANAVANASNTVSFGNSSGTRRIIYVTDPANAQDAATKNYVDDQYSVLEAQIDDKGSDITTLQGQVSTLETTVAGKADTSALNNYATKTELNAKADQTAVDSLTTTVNGKVSSVTAGEGISITGTATEPVISASSENIFFTPDFDNAVEFDAEAGQNYYTFTADGFVKPGGSYAQVGQPPSGMTDIRYRIKSSSQSTWAAGGAEQYLRNGYGSGSTAPIIPVKAGDSIEVADGSSGMDAGIWSHDTILTSGTFFPLKQSTITPNEFADTGWMEITGSSGNGLKYLTGPWTIPVAAKVKIRKFGKRVTVVGVVQATEDISSDAATPLLSIPESDPHFDAFNLPQVSQYDIAHDQQKCAVTSAILVHGVLTSFNVEQNSDTPSINVTLVPVVGTAGLTAQIENGDTVNFQISWDTED